MPSEQTHDTNIATLLRANAVSKQLGDRFNPVQESIRPPVVDAFATDCEAQLTKTYKLERDYANAREERKAAFLRLAPFGTRLVNAFIGCRSSEETVRDTRTLVKKIRGIRIAKKTKAAASDTPAEVIARQISVAQTSYDSRQEHFNKMVIIARHLGDRYKASAPDLRIEALEEKLKGMDAANVAVMKASAVYTAALVERDRLLYHPETGLVARMKDIRSEFIATFGSGSPEHKMLTGMRVRNLRNKRLEAVPA